MQLQSSTLQYMRTRWVFRVQRIRQSDATLGRIDACHTSELATTLAMARSMLRARDRLRGGFENAPLDAELTLPQAAAWDTYILGRISRMDIEVKKQAALYNFRNRHGFNDASDHVFEKIWNTDSVTWDELSALSANTLTLSA